MSIKSAEYIEQPTGAETHGKSPAMSRPFSLGDWYIVPELNRLKSKSDKEERQLEPRLIKLLCYLAANEDRVLTRDELVQELWPRVIVNENSLTRAISELRKQLQAGDSSVSNYIETIPKRGYRLIPRVEFATENTAVSVDRHRPRETSLFTLPSFRFGAALSAACLCLVVASWISVKGMPMFERDSEAIFLSDEVLDTEHDYLGGELRFSSMESDPIIQAIATPVVSLDDKQYAFIQYDTSGSTIFLGGLGTAIEPVPVYYSNQHLFNLAWSPIGNNLLFAVQPFMASNAAYSPMNETAELVMLNLNTLETSRLIEDRNPAEANSSNELNLS
mgnify:CR=1 FL=1